MKILKLSPFVIFVCLFFASVFGKDGSVYNIQKPNIKNIAANEKLETISNSNQNLEQQNAETTAIDEFNIFREYYELPKTIEKILPAVVSISAIKNSSYSEYYDDMNSNNLQSLGSGFIISEDGYIVTNNHVIEGAERINVKLKGSDTNFPAEVVGIDEVMDIALLKIKLKAKLPYVELDEINNYQVGDLIIVAGNPYNLGISVSTGIISALNRNLQMTSFDNFIQTDASINKGNSGGPMFNIKGKVIGLTSAIYSPEGEKVGIGFAMPVADLIPVIQELKKYGYVRRGWIGVTTENTQKEIFEILNTSVKRGGVVVIDVVKSGPAEKAGMAISDIIINYNGKKIRNVRDLSVLISSSEVGSTVVIDVLRGNKILNLRIKVEETKENDKYDPQYEAILSKAIEVFDMVLIPMNRESRKKFKISDDSEGMYVLKIKKGGLADKKGIRTGDIILSVNQDLAIDANIIMENIHRARLNKINYIFLITKGSKNNLIFMPISKENNSSAMD